jgi:type I restriction enzyme S subunit
MEAVLDKIKVEKYSSYKNSGAEWLGDIPTHWNTLSNKNIFKLKKNQVGKKSSDYVLLSLTLNGVIKRDMENPQGKFPAEFNTYQEVKKGDFIFCLFDVEETPRCVGLSDFDGMITGAYTVMEPYDNFDRNFLYYFNLNLDADKRMKPLYTGLRNTISKENFFSFKTFVPPLLEQTAIAAFLDRKTALIDQAIDIKQKQIELLKERRQILIHKVVTRGLNPNVQLKDSGVEWIGEIPEHWQVKRFKHFTKILSGYSPEQVKFSEEMKINYFKVDDLNNVDENFRLGNSNWFVEHLKIAKVYSSNILLIPKRGGAIGTNKIAVTTTDCIFDTNVMGLEFNLLKVNIDLIAIWLKSRNLITIADTTTIPQINNKHIYPLEIALPKLEEQTEIIQYIKTSSQKLNTAISLKEQEIEKLKEYKATLINSAVTGKIKVSATV